MPGPLFVLGPQRPEPNVPKALAAVPGHGPVVLISAGWRLDETETPDVLRRMGIPVVHLPLYAWFEEVRERAPALESAWSARQSDIQAFKHLYQVRMRSLLEACATLSTTTDPTDRSAREELDDAVEDVRRLDDRVLERTGQIIHAHPDTLHTWEHPVVAPRHAEARELLMSARAILVAGGHVGVLRSRLWFFGLHRLLPEAWENGAAVIAWSAGAMALSERVVLFYDDPPEGPTWPELLDKGVGLLPQAVFLPHARQRLRLNDRVRVGLLASRFGPGACLGLELGAWLEWDGTAWINRGDPNAVIHLHSDGHVSSWEGPGA